MKITHHLDPATILAFAAGTLGEGLRVVAAAHAAWCPECRAALHEAEEVGGALMFALAEAPVAEAVKERTLALTGQATVHRLSSAAPRQDELPLPLQALAGAASIDALPWRKKAPGLEMIELHMSRKGRGRLALMRIGAGRAMPDHGHGGEELTLILKGAYSDRFGLFRAGDVADLDDDAEHKPVVTEDAPCVCLIATEAPTRFKHWPARLLQPFIGI